MENMRKLRREKGISAKQLADMVGVSEVSITQYENGKRSPKKATLLKIADALGTSVEYLNGKKEIPVQIDMDRVDLALLSEMVDLTPSECQKVRAFVSGLKANRAE